MTAHRKLAVGARVYHGGQIWARTLVGGTGAIVRVEGPDRHGDYEYLVRTGGDFSRQPGPDNPETDERWWSSSHVREAWTEPIW